VDERETYGEDRYGLVAMVENRLLFVAYTLRGDRIRIISAEGPSRMSTESTMKAAKPTKHNWDRFDAMTEQQRHAAALSDPDARPLSAVDFKRMKRTPR